MNELKRIWRAGGYSWQGIRAAFQHEPAFRTELLLFVILLPCVYWLGESIVQYALLLGALFLVLLTELVNSAIEAVVDRFGEQQHELSGRAKDMASAVVFIAIINFFVIWGLLLYNRITN
jgi:diacylglycerol kinase (ATP)